MSQIIRFKLSLLVMFVLVNSIFASSSFAAEKGRSAYEAIMGGDGLDIEEDQKETSKQITPKQPAEDHNNQTTDETMTDSNELFKENDNVGILLVKLAFYTMVVVALIYGLVKFMASRQRKFQHHQVFKTLGGTQMGANKSLQLVEVGGKMYLIGVGDGINLIDKISDPDQAKSILNDIDQQQSIITKSIADLIKSKFPQKGRAPDPDPAKPQQNKAEEFRQLFHDTLHNQRLKRQEIERSLQD